MRVWICSALALAAAAPSNASAIEPAFSHYTLRPGDTLAMLARTGLVGRGALARVKRLNHIHSVRRLVVGQVLRIPRVLLRDESTSATIETWLGPVDLTTRGQPLPLRSGAVIGEGAHIVTGRFGFVTMRLRDGSTVTLPSQSDVTILRLRRVLLTGAVEREFTLTNGRAHLTVTPMTLPDSTFRVTTPVSVSAVRGTDFRVAYIASNQTATTAVDEGQVSVNGLNTKGEAVPAQSSLVPAGSGVAVTLQGTGSPTRLLPAPALEDPERVQTAGDLEFRVTPSPASAYRAQISRDAGAVDIVAESESAGPVLKFASIAPGTWFVRLSSIDSQGIEGAVSSYAFDRYRNEVDGTMDVAAMHRHRTYQFKWSGIADGPVHYRFRLWLDGQAATPTIDEIGLRSNALNVSDLAPGKYHWNVASILLVGHRVIESRSPDREFFVVKPR